jgi:hypothetical protein
VSTDLPWWMRKALPIRKERPSQPAILQSPLSWRSASPVRHSYCKASYDYISYIALLKLLQPCRFSVVRTEVRHHVTLRSLRSGRGSCDLERKPTMESNFMSRCLRESALQASTPQSTSRRAGVYKPAPSVSNQRVDVRVYTNLLRAYPTNEST